MSSRVADLRSVKALMFDFYGTVVDMQSGLTAAIAPYLEAKGYEGPPSSVVTWWRRTHFENSMIDALLHREHTPYREIGHRALAQTLARAKISHTRADVELLVQAIESLDPFPDVIEALTALHSRYGLIVLSNGDPDMLERGTAHVGFPFDEVISVAKAGSFKPHVVTYRTACEVIDLEPVEVLFVANHEFDCVGAKSFGMRTAYVNRRNRPFGETPYLPDLQVKDFPGLASAMGTPFGPGG
ncbi:MAG: haloacid dehalogenase type II [Mycobacteriales bacterium]